MPNSAQDVCLGIIWPGWWHLYYLDMSSLSNLQPGVECVLFKLCLRWIPLKDMQHVVNEIMCPYASEIGLHIVRKSHFHFFKAVPATGNGK